jgi:hypothetical protein
MRQPDAFPSLENERATATEVISHEGAIAFLDAELSPVLLRCKPSAGRAWRLRKVDKADVK